MLLRVARNKYNLLLMPRWSSFLFLIVLLAVSLTPAAGHASLKQFGKIKGQIVDVNNARIARADVLIVGEGLRWQLLTNTEGEFQMSLPTGEYQLSIEAPGFRRYASQKFQIKSGKTQSFKIEMKVAQLQVPASLDQESDFCLMSCVGLAGQVVRALSNV